ncbi:MAG: DEAD/DEAH box helicase, partial [Rhodospirillaceae bacterium]|nr:DEAD/DEAH box helicase [Rhodospirillaceae bacterium]
MADPAITFDDLGLKPEVLRAVHEIGYRTPTPIQAQAIPVVLMGRDMIGIAQTGTGKTAGFTLPMIEILSRGRARARMPRSLILEPTRELASQVAENFETYGKYDKLNYALLIGGTNMDEQIRKLDRGVDVLIATPGRMLDLFERGKVLLADVKILVIDEADRMLDMGFIPDIERIIGLLPPLRQTLLFSATMPPEIRRLAARFLSNPKEIAVSRPATTAETVDQRLVRVAMRDKRAALRALLRSEQPRNALVFCNRKRDVGIVCRSLQRHGFSAGQLHGDMVQSARQETLEGFKRGDPVVLVCSDVAARGIDIDQLSHVFNFDVPHHAEDYVHRIGRTGRAGRAGKSITLATPEEAKSLSAVEKLIGRPIEPLAVDLGDRTDADSEEAEEPRGGPRHGRRSSQPARKAAPKPPARPAPPPRREPPPKPPEAEAKPRRARPAPRQEREDPPVVGLGDHVPAFLRPPKPKR